MPNYTTEKITVIYYLGRQCLLSQCLTSVKRDTFSILGRVVRFADNFTPSNDLLAEFYPQISQTLAFYEKGLQQLGCRNHKTLTLKASSQFVELWVFCLFVCLFGLVLLTDSCCCYFWQWSRKAGLCLAVDQGLERRSAGSFFLDTFSQCHVGM